ncbi:hypothetical protein N1030_01315 [Desulfovibrio mangrovi]|uniref:hypothetical protein n=1 Tax=Desulfovibrio mangrovi TaxID=2976983 RepID=UPI00224594A5|nr:hypothetical protein [Desulfovibrio mangrovi]UZP67633.1 hypothetical protein N1030_01315 [Desulfovibrio mangrovi]
MNEQQDAALKLLVAMLAPSARDNRDTRLLCCPERDVVHSSLRESPLFCGWCFRVDTCFLDPLDIKYQQRAVNKVKYDVWTQGSAFSFKVGHTFYRKDGQMLIQVHDAKESVPGRAESERDSGYVLVQCYEPNNGPTKWKTAETFGMTQDEFVRYLIAGDVG